MMESCGNPLQTRIQRRRLDFVEGTNKNFDTFVKKIAEISKNFDTFEKKIDENF